MLMLRNRCLNVSSTLLAFSFFYCELLITPNCDGSNENKASYNLTPDRAPFLSVSNSRAVHSIYIYIYICQAICGRFSMDNRITVAEFRFDAYKAINSSKVIKHCHLLNIALFFYVPSRALRVWPDASSITSRVLSICLRKRVLY